MSSFFSLSNKLIKTSVSSFILVGLVNISTAQEVPIVLPGAPGQSSQILSPQEAIEIADNSYSLDDVKFMQDMIPHHRQAVEMASLVKDRTNLQEIVDVAGRIDASQLDEIAFMEQWLEERGEPTTSQAEHGGMHTSHTMAGMATEEQMAELASSSGNAFDEMFLRLMMRHHEGAIKMVDKLLDQPGAAYDPILYDFTNDVTNDQESEIKRMNDVLTSLSVDARAGLNAGFRDAGEAASNLNLVASLPKPAGFFDPKNPAGLPIEIPAEESNEPYGLEQALRSRAQERVEANVSNRSPLLSFSNTDMAFSGDKLIVGNYHGFNIYNLDNNGLPTLYSSVVCPGGQGDVSIVDDLLIMSVEQTRGRVDCGLEGVSGDVSDERFRGIRIFDISNLAGPVQVGQVQTCRGSHTHSVVSGPGEDGKIIVYNSGTSSVRDEEELPGCIGNIAGDERTALFRIDVIEIPVADPSKARIISSPAVFADHETGNIAGLWQGGDHGEETQRTSQTNQCHDITVFPANKIAAGACSGNGIIFDISDPLNPKRIDEVIDKGFAYWHSATFNNDGSKVIFTDEWGGGGRPRCQAHDPKTWGANAIYDIVDGKLVFKSHYKLPAPQSETENCVAHNGSSVPVPGRDIFVQAWYQGGLSVMDFTDSSNPIELAYFDRGPVSDKHIVTGGFWSTYWYNGKIYGTEIARGLDVMELTASEFLSENELAAASIANQGQVFNPQQQLPVTWPQVPVVARAYIDQLTRSNDISQSIVTALNTALDSAESLIENGESNAELAAQLINIGKSIKVGNENSISKKRAESLVEVLNNIASEIS